MAIEGQGFGGMAAGGPPPLAVRAEFLPRLGAYLIDGVILAVIHGVFALIALAMTDGRGEGGAVTALNGLAQIIGIIYFIYFWNARGATPGMMALNLRVVNEQGTSPTIGQAVIRYIGYIVGAIPLFLGYFWALGQQRRAWHDLMAGTYVIKQQ